MAGFAQGVFGDIRKGGRMADLTQAEIKKMVDDYFRAAVERIEDAMVERRRPMNPDEHETYLELIESFKGNYREALGTSNYRDKALRDTVDQILADAGVTIEKESYSYKKLCREILKVWVEAYGIEEKALLGDYSFEAEITPALPIAAPEVQQSELVSVIMKKYAQEYQKADRWTPKTTEETLSSLRLFIAIVGDVPVHTIDHKVMRYFKGTLIQLPPNQNKVRKYRGKSVEQILKMKPEKTLSVSSITKIHGRVSSLFTWAVDNGHMGRNCAGGMNLKQNKRPDEFRDPFTRDDLKLLFHSELYREDAHTRSYTFWMPILGLFTGARIEELAQLHLDDIREDNGVWVFDINKNAPDKKLKNKASKRLVPIHPFLVDELKLPPYVDGLRAKRHTRLFPELTRTRDGYSPSVSKWFSRYAQACGVTGEKKTFHAFRHSFANVLKQDYDVQMPMVSEVLGHAGNSITSDRYAQRYAPDVLLERVIMKLQFDVDLGHLKGSQFVGSQG